MRLHATRNEKVLQGERWKPQASRLRSLSFNLSRSTSKEGNRRLHACGGVSFSPVFRPKLRLRRDEPGGFFEVVAVVARSKLTNCRGEPGSVQEGNRGRTQIFLSKEEL
jgi:hypothetical protein